MKIKNQFRISFWIDAICSTVFSFAVCTVLYLAFINISFFDAFSNAFRDFEFTDLYYSKALPESNISDNIILVNVQYADRAEIAEAIDKIAEQNPTVIGLDLIFRDRKTAIGDSTLYASLMRHENIVTSCYFDGDAIVENNPYFSPERFSSGFINLYPRDGQTVIRDYLAWKTDSSNDTIYSFAARLAMRHNPNLIPELKSLDRIFPIDYTTDLDNFVLFELDEILLSDDPIPIIDGGIVILAYLGVPTGNPHDIEDKHFTPLNDHVAGKSTPDMYGAAIHANVLRMFVEDNFVWRVPTFWNYCLAFALATLATYWALVIMSRKYILHNLLIKGYQLVWSIGLVYFSLLLLKMGVLISVTSILLLVILSVEMIDSYLNLKNYLKKKFL